MRLESLADGGAFFSMKILSSSSLSGEFEVNFRCLGTSEIYAATHIDGGGSTVQHECMLWFIVAVGCGRFFVR